MNPTLAKEISPLQFLTGKKLLLIFVRQSFWQSPPLFGLIIPASWQRFKNNFEDVWKSALKLDVNDFKNPAAEVN
jgi:hypothetical protein